MINTLNSWPWTIWIKNIITVLYHIKHLDWSSSVMAKNLYVNVLLRSHWRLTFELQMSPMVTNGHQFLSYGQCEVIVTLTFDYQILQFILESKWTLVPSLKKFPQDVPEIRDLQEWDGHMKNPMAIASMEEKLSMLIFIMSRPLHCLTLTSHRMYCNSIEFYLG